jgi:hypothetical protein
MKVDGVSAPISPPIVRPQASPKPPESEPEVTAGEDGGGKANGVISKLNKGGHFNAVADIRLRISHFDNEGLDKIDPYDPDLLPAPEEVPGKAYEKFLDQYRALYDASQTPTEPEEPVDEIPAPDPAPVIEEPIVEVPPVSDGPVAEIPVPDPVPVIEEPVVEVPPVSEEPVVEIPIPDPVPVIVTPLEIAPVAITPEQTELEAPVDEGNGILAAFEELWQAQALEEKPGILDIVI